MKLHTKRTLVAVAAAGLFAFGLSACGAADTGSSPQAASDKTDEPVTSGTLTCDDLTKQTEKTGVKEGITFDDVPDEKMTTLYTWMAANGKKFKDVELGKNVTAVGKYGPEYDASEHPADDVFNGYVDGSTAIDKSCPDIGFGFVE